MLSYSKLIGFVIVCLTLGLLPTHVSGQFWKNALSEYQTWEREMLANRASGICYKIEYVHTSNPELRQRQISTCCPGYVNRGSSKVLKCEPMCPEDCTHGVCLAPGYCECAPGYYREQAQCRKFGE